MQNEKTTIELKTSTKKKLKTLKLYLGASSLDAVVKIMYSFIVIHQKSKADLKSYMIERFK